jgi:hypothetical protein
MESANSELGNSKLRIGRQIGLRLNLMSGDYPIYQNWGRYTGIFTGSRLLEILNITII